MTSDRDRAFGQMTRRSIRRSGITRPIPGPERRHALEQARAFQAATLAPGASNRREELLREAARWKREFRDAGRRRGS
jgi:uroporphyrinogen-III synthase